MIGDQLETKQHCPHCGRAVHSRPYVMASRREAPLLPTKWAVVVLVAVVVVCLAVARLHGG